MKLELRSITHNTRLSEETPAYAADLYVDGVKAAHLSNHGTGGPDMCHWLDRAIEAKVDAHFAALPKEKYGNYELQPNLESWAHTQLENRAFLKSFKRSLAKKIIIYTADKRGLNLKATPDRLPAIRAQIETKYPGAIILNEASDEQLLAIAA